MQEFISLLLGRPVKLRMKEDNQACIQAVKNGYSPALRHLTRTIRLSIGALNEQIFPDSEEMRETAEEFGTVDLEYAPSLEHKGDLFTKVLGAVPYARALEMINI